MLLEIAHGEAAFADFVAALRQAGLPTDDLNAAPFRYFCRDGVAWGGIGHGDDALLRSVVVQPSVRGGGHGAAIVEALVTQARADGTRRLWLLTTDSAPFFARLGWRPVDRTEAPAPIAGSRQFSDVCPSSATLMMRAL
ncbi:arsenic resistance N-acetyltransferase ArsN2 [Terricaulis silvestris]|uniref:N-acetylglutamate synthase n=1 Tax=Terricaulis silvestris TaxID=2686094 RepID=A0A6I6MQJ3_9CAUL|nr:arsenic resistance N-acetyltransferase ArsN2 [Terricaulis silvestris]QGZ96431.1 N-acetylglutamate synthase [Terricaulis silvestris]